MVWEFPFDDCRKESIIDFYIVRAFASDHRSKEHVTCLLSFKNRHVIFREKIRTLTYVIMNFNCQHAQYLFSDTPVPHFNSQPFQVFSTPGLGNFYNDHTLYTPIKTFGFDEKEVEKQIEPDESGGFEINAPLIVRPLVTSQKKSRKGATHSDQKGHGKTKTTKRIRSQSPTEREIQEALEHPIKVLYNITLINIILFFF